MERDYLVWSHEHAAWWGPGRCGYVHNIETAGRYTRAEAREIVRDATCFINWARNVPNEVPVWIDDLPNEIQEILKGA